MASVKPFVSLIFRARRSLADERLGLALAEDAGVVGPIVFAIEARQQLAGLLGLNPVDGIEHNHAV